MRGRPRLDRDGNPLRVLGIVMDVTEERRREERLKESERRLLAANQAKSQFLANVSHEIRTPLGAILGFTELIADPEVPQDEKNRYVEIMRQSGHQLATVINDILDLSKVEAGKLDIQVYSFSLPSLVSEVASFLRPLAAQKGVELSIGALPKALPPTISSDPARIKQVLTNIIGNAIKFTSRGGRIELTLCLHEGLAAINIRDTGIGIKEEHQKRVFDPFFQVDSSMARKTSGTGLGLALSKQLAKLLGGDLLLMESHPGEGSTFRFCFSLDLRDQVKESPRKPAAPKKSIAGARVLLADDSPDNQLLISRFLNSAGARVDTADNGQEAVQKAMNNRYSVILMDIQMPVLDGYRATQTLREKGYKGKIVALTAHALKEEREHSIEVGCDDHLTKPVNRAELIETVAKFI